MQPGSAPESAPAQAPALAPVETPPGSTKQGSSKGVPVQCFPALLGGRGVGGGSNLQDVFTHIANQSRHVVEVLTVP